MKKKNKNNLIFLSIILSLIVVLIAAIAFSNFQELSTDNIAIIPIKGEISLYDSSGFFSSEGVSAETTLNRINKAKKDPTVKAIILEINSQGGTVVATKEIADALKELDKPVVSWIREIGASGGYWIASTSDIIVADPASITGSIGVVGAYLQFSELFEKYGINYERIVSGKYKDLGSPYKELTPEEEEVLLSKMNSIHTMFIEEIKNNRELNSEAIDKISTAEWFLGIEAKDLGLVDVLGSKKEAVFYARKLANISSSELIKYTKEKSFFQKLASVLSQSSYFVGKGIGDSIISVKNNEALLVN